MTKLCDDVHFGNFKSQNLLRAYLAAVCRRSPELEISRLLTPWTGHSHVEVDNFNEVDKGIPSASVHGVLTSEKGVQTELF